MKTMGKTDVYLPLQSITSTFNMTGNINLRDFTSFHTNFLDFKFQKSSDLLILNNISAGAYEIWQPLVTPRPWGQGVKCFRSQKPLISNKLFLPIYVAMWLKSAVKQLAMPWNNSQRSYKTIDVLQVTYVPKWTTLDPFHMRR